MANRFESGGPGCQHDRMGHLRGSHGVQATPGARYAQRARLRMCRPMRARAPRHLSDPDAASRWLVPCPALMVGRMQPPDLLALLARGQIRTAALIGLDLAHVLAQRL